MKKKYFALVYAVTLFYLFTGCVKSNTISNNNSNNISNKNNITNSSSDDINKNSNDNNTNPSENSTKKEKSTSESSKTINTPCRLYFFNSVDLTLYYVDTNIPVTDNALVTALTSELQRNPYSDSFITLSNKIGVKSAKLDEKKGLITIYFNDSYIKFMNLGSATETGLLNALINTYGYNYGVNKVAIYFNDELYTSLKGDLPEGYFTVNYSNSFPYNGENKTTTTNSSDINSTVTKNCRIFYYCPSDDCYYYNDKELTIAGKAVITSLTNELKSPPDSKLLAFPETLYVKNANLNNDTGILTVDLDKSYYNILQNLGSPGECGALKSLAYTYGYYYGITKIIITIEGKSYSGSHILYEDGEYINIDSIKAIPIK